MFLCNFGNSHNINDLHGRIGWGFRPDQFRVLIDVLIDVFCIRQINEVEFDPEFLIDFRKQTVSSAIQIISRDYFISRFQ
ncbi:hypothetical protein D3C86_1601430 [compost metagenome]